MGDYDYDEVYNVKSDKPQPESAQVSHELMYECSHFNDDITCKRKEDGYVGTRHDTIECHHIRRSGDFGNCGFPSFTMIWKDATYVRFEKSEDWHDLDNDRAPEVNISGGICSNASTTTAVSTFEATKSPQPTSTLTSTTTPQPASPHTASEQCPENNDCSRSTDDTDTAVIAGLGSFLGVVTIIALILGFLYWRGKMGKWRLNKIPEVADGTHQRQKFNKLQTVPSSGNTATSEEKAHYVNMGVGLTLETFQDPLEAGTKDGDGVYEEIMPISGLVNTNLGDNEYPGIEYVDAEGQS